MDAKVRNNLVVNSVFHINNPLLEVSVTGDWHLWVSDRRYDIIVNGVSHPDDIGPTAQNGSVLHLQVLKERVISLHALREKQTLFINLVVIEVPVLRQL